MRRKMAALAAGVVMAAAVPASARWVEAKTDHFVIYGDMPEARAAAYAQDVERFDQMLRMFANTPDNKDAPTERVTVYVLPSLSALQSLTRSRNLAGFYSGSAQDSHAVMPLSIPSEYLISAQHVLFHEYTHHIMLSATNANYPSWVQEGFAEFFGTARPKDDGTMVVGAPPQTRGYALNTAYQMSLENLFRSDGMKLSDEDMNDKYARGWLLTHYLLLGKKRPGQLDQYLRLLREGVPSLTAAKQAFGSLGKLDGELAAYNRSKFPAMLVPADMLKTGQVTTRTLRPCEAEIMPTRIRSASGVTDKTAPELVPPARAIAAKCANDPFVERALAEIEFDAKNNDASMAASDRTLTLDPANIMAMVYKGRVLARQGKWADARKWFIKANRANPNYALPLMLYYDSFMRAGEAPPKIAVDGLFRAVVLVPQDDQLRLRAGYALIRQGDLKTARMVLAPVAFSPHAKPADNPALKVLQKIDAGADVKAVMAEADTAKWRDLGKE
ncbi:MAG: hypothetical protein ABIR51_06615 [Sphingomicrobium sp.]